MPELPLEGHVMNRENAGRLRKTWFPPVFNLSQCRDQSRLPVVGMENVRIQTQNSGRFHHRPTEENKSLAVIPKVLIILDVQPGPVKVNGLIDQVNLNVRAGQNRTQNSAFNLFGPYADIN